MSAGSYFQARMVFKQIRHLLPVLATAGMVIGVHGLQLTLVAVRGASHGFSVSLIGVMSAVYSLGFAIGCLWATRLLGRFSHSQIFTILVTVAASVAAMMASTAEPAIWIGLRLVSGFAYAGLLALIEGYINANASNSHRAQILSIYRFVTLGAVAAAQYAIPLVGVNSSALFLLISAVLVATLLPFSRVKTAGSAAAITRRFDLSTAWRISPLAVLGSIAAGMTATTFRSTGPVYAHLVGMTPAGIATFMSAGLMGGLILQYPLAFFSDRMNRIAVIVVTLMGAVAVAGFLSAFADTNTMLNMIGIAIFGAFSFPVYALCSAHGHDRAGHGHENVALAASLLFFVSLGGALGPLLVSALMQHAGHAAFFLYMMSVHGFMGAYAVYALTTGDLNKSGEAPRRSSVP